MYTVTFYTATYITCFSKQVAIIKHAIKLTLNAVNKFYIAVLTLLKYD
jgi:hypothetical protein